MKGRRCSGSRNSRHFSRIFTEKLMPNRGHRRAGEIREEYATWERNGRGWALWDFSVDLEPPFLPVSRPVHRLMPVNDDARLAGRFVPVGLQNRIRELQRQPSRAEASTIGVPVVPNAHYRSEPIVELQILPPTTLAVTPSLSEQFILSIAKAHSPVSFEIVANDEEIRTVLAGGASSADYFKNQVRGFFPGSLISEGRDSLAQLNPSGTVIADFALSREFGLPLHIFRSFDPDPLMGLVSSLANLRSSEIAIIQILFQTTRMPWGERLKGYALDPLLKESGDASTRSISSYLKEKLAGPLHAVVLRLAVSSNTAARSWDIFQGITPNFSVFSNPGANELIALSNNGYAPYNHFLALKNRTSYRSGMLLNANELASIAHIPSTGIGIDKIARNTMRSKKAPPAGVGDPILDLGGNLHDGQLYPVRITSEQYTRHMFICGGSGGGCKSCRPAPRSAREQRTGRAMEAAVCS